MISKKRILCALVVVGGMGMVYYTKTGEGYKKRTNEYSPLPMIIEAVQRGDVGGLQSLLNRGANIEQLDDRSHTAFTLATQGSKKAIFYLLLPKANILHAIYDGSTALMFATQNGDIDLVYALLNDSRVTPEYINAQNKAGKTALKYAQEKGNAELVELLKRKGAIE